MNECPIDKLNILKARLEEIKYTKLVLNDDCFNLAWEIINIGILTANSLDDSYHIAASVINNFSVDDIHAIREEQTKRFNTMSNEELKKYFEEEIRNFTEEKFLMIIKF